MIKINEIINQLKLTGVYLDDSFKLCRGVNSISYIVKENEDKYFLKIYKKDNFNKFNRINSEIKFISYLSKNNFSNIPKIKSFDYQDKWILLHWLDGEKIKEIRKEYVEKLLLFLIKIQRKKIKSNLIDMPNACESCFSLVKHKELIQTKISTTINHIKSLEKVDNNLSRKINEELNNKIYLIDEIYQKNNNKELWNYELNFNQKCLSPSDVGFHNILLSNNSLTFFDFEFAGFDDPCKLIVDLILQPDFSIPSEYIYLMNKLVDVLKSDIPNFKERLEIIFQLYLIKWFCIIFNPLIKKDINSLKKEDLKIKLDKARSYFSLFENKKYLLLNNIS
jgi:hypothetical protein